MGLLLVAGQVEAQGPGLGLQSRVERLEAAVAALQAGLAAEEAARSVADAALRSAIDAETAARQAADAALQVKTFSDFQPAPVDTSGASFLTLAAVDLPAGKYVIHAKASALDVFGGDSKLPYCVLSARDSTTGATSLIDVSQALFPPPAFGQFRQRVALALLSRVELTGGGSVRLDCANNLGFMHADDVVRFQEGVLTAVEVAALQ